MTSYKRPTTGGGHRPTFRGGARPTTKVPQNWSNLFSDVQAVERFSVGPFARLVGQVFFQKTNSDIIDDLDRDTLRDLALTCSIIEREEPLRFWFVGLADYRGSEEYNERLGFRRASNVKDYFEKQLLSIEPSTRKTYFHVISWGESKSLQPNIVTHNLTRGFSRSRKSQIAINTANWRRVDIYVNLPRGDFEKAEENVKKLKRKLQKWAGQALRRHRQAILNLSKQAEMYKKRTLNPSLLKGDSWSAGLVYLDNALMLDDFVGWLKEVQERYLDLQGALEKGDSAFLEWDKKWFGNKSRGQERLRRMQALHQKMKKKLASAPDEEKRALQNMVEALENEIRTYREDLESSQPLD